MPRQSRRAACRLRSLAAAAVVVATATSSVTAAFFSSPLDSLLRRQAAAGPALDPLSVVYSNASAAQPKVVSSEPHRGRYGHSAVYLPAPSNILLLIGGQVADDSGVAAITQDVLKFRLASSFLWGDRPVSAIPDNPAVDTLLSSGRPASAWTAAAFVPDAASTWLVGGVTADCETDPLVHTLTSSLSAAWSTQTLKPRAPPRRRQAAAIPVANTTTGGTDVWVFGGIADQYTCSRETIGYVGIDRYDTVRGTVESMPWNPPVGVAEPKQWQAPVSDYSAALLGDRESILVVGGQTAEGDLVRLNQALVFNVKTRAWSQHAVGGAVPSPRMGHSALVLPSGSILVYGGLSPLHLGLSDISILNPKTWTWTTVGISDHSMASPALAWHSATLIEGGTIVVAFGLDGATGMPSSQFWFLTIDETAGTYTWMDTFDGNGAAVASAIAANSAPRTKMARRGEVVAKELKAMVMNPKAGERNAAGASQTADSFWTAAEPVATAADGTVAGAADTPAPTSTQAEPATPPAETASSAAAGSSGSLSYSPPFADQASSSSAASNSPTSLPATAKSNSASGAASPVDKSTIIGASVGGIAGAVALIGLAFFVIRRRAAAAGSAHGPSTPAMGYSGPRSGDGSGPDAPFVSQMLYTRPVQARNMSLGSTAPALSPRLSDNGDDALEGDNMAGVGSRGVRLSSEADPFADTNRVNEVGQFEGSGAGAGGGASAGLAAALQSSARSTPFLSSVTRTSDPTPAPQDSFTSAPPKLAARGSIRRPRPSQPQTPALPGTPAELIGMAITSDDGHDALPYLTVSSPSEEGSTSHDGATTGHAASTTLPAPIPAALRPGTPLHIANPDPFADR